jgi:hypothetical protein
MRFSALHNSSSKFHWALCNKLCQTTLQCRHAATDVKRCRLCPRKYTAGGQRFVVALAVAERYPRLSNVPAPAAAKLCCCCQHCSCWCALQLQEVFG